MMQKTRKLGLAAAAASLAIAPVMTQSAAAQVVSAEEIAEQGMGAMLVVGSLVLITAGIFIADKIDDDDDNVPVSP